jgi:hypothetical protein
MQLEQRPEEHPPEAIRMVTSYKTGHSHPLFSSEALAPNLSGLFIQGSPLLGQGRVHLLKDSHYQEGRDC